jgi:thiol:disulfide interchange protein
MTPPLRSLALGFVCALIFGPALNAQLPGFGGPSKHLSAELISEESSIAPGKAFRVAIRLEHEEHWHSYGKVIPNGVTGKPTRIIWTLPEGWKTEDLAWPPTKKVPSTGGTISEGYDGIVYLGVRLTPPASLKPGSTTKLEAQVDALVCDPQSCVPVRDLNVSLELKVATEPVTDPKHSAVFKDMAASDAPPIVKPAPPSPARDGSLLYYLVLAFFGGMILNIMPCVFPVLAIKITSVVSQAHEDKRKLLLHGLAYTFGVLVSLWTLAGVLLALRSTGGQFGWGFQLQSPWFVYAVVLIMVIFGLNMAGLFEVGTSAVGVGGNLTAKSGVAGSFLSGLFATVVATPCTAPLLANALPVALALPAAGALTFFTVIGLGLAAPYLVLSLAPGLLKKLPRPGAWMESFKQGMSFLMLGAAGYFVWVLMGLISDENQRDLLIGLSVIAMAFWIYGRWCVISKPARTRLRGGMAALLVLALGIWWSHPREKGLKWEKWSPQSVKELVGNGKPVYVDFTARWCSTCQFNHRVYDAPEIRAAIKQRGIVLLKADWTDYDPVISQTLKSDFQTEAVPLNVLYLPGRDKPVILPNLLTVANVTAAFAELDKAQ